MPQAAELARGGAIKHRTLALRNGRFLKLSIVRNAGPRGGHTLPGPLRTRKARNHG